MDYWCVLKHADRIGILPMAKRLNELIEQARSRTIALEDLQQGDVYHHQLWGCGEWVLESRLSGLPRPRFSV